MNGLMLRPKPAVDQSPKASGWWEKQHLKRGLNAQGRPFGLDTDDEPTTSSAYRAVIEDDRATPPQQKRSDGGEAGGPMHTSSSSPKP
jgi:hypothetical protein